MLHQRKLTLFLLSLLSLVAPPSWAAPTLVCTVCGLKIQEGYEIQGAVYCSDHWRQALPRCSNCGVEIQGDYSAVGVQMVPVCLQCSEANPACYLCGSPADPSTGGGRLADGRPICGTEKAEAVFSPQQARLLFEQAGREVRQTLGRGMALKVPIKELRLVDVPHLLVAAKGQYQKSTLMSGRVLGLSTLTLKSRGARRWTEPAVIHLLNGVTKTRMLTVCAHEYAHVWHSENHRNYARTTPEMREGFAEWVAYKVAQSAGRQSQVAILHYPSGGLYYEGLRKFLELEARAGVDGVLKHAVEATSL